MGRSHEEREREKAKGRIIYWEWLGDESSSFLSKKIVV